MWNILNYVGYCSIDDLLRDTDSEMEDDDATVTSKKGNKKKTKQAQPKQGSAWLKENDDIVDFLDSSAANKVTCKFIF